MSAHTLGPFKFIEATGSILSEADGRPVFYVASGRVARFDNGRFADQALNCHDRYFAALCAIRDMGCLHGRIARCPCPCCLAERALEAQGEGREADPGAPDVTAMMLEGFER